MVSDVDVVPEHYRRLGPDYNALLRYSPDFVRTLTAEMIRKLRLHEDDRLLDLGCGTGLYSVDLLEQVRLRHPIIGVDAFEEMLANVPEHAAITPVRADALEFSGRAGSYDKILIKESIHHIDQREQLFANLYERLTPGGIMLLVHVPPRVDYPLFQAALERCLSWHADPDELVIELEAAGFTVERDAVEYEHSLPKERYFDMVRNRYMSVLTSFTDEELAAGLDEMARTHADRDVLRFTDHFDAITATKTLATAE